ncbi:response regulator [Persicitalea sp.]|uniref:response regulator n=1 Tax=Persicitalea sp. TaxID=3100273 RepID=UPI003593A629
MLAQTVSTEPLRILIVEDHFAASRGIRATLSQNDAWEVTGEMTCIADALKAIETQCVQILITDLHLVGGESGIKLATLARKVAPDLKVVLHTMEESPEVIRAAIGADVDAYTLKDDDEDELLLAVRQVSRGKRYYSPRVADFLSQLTSDPDEQKPISDITLTQQQINVMCLVAKGLPNHEILDMLDILPTTLSTHRNRLYQKLGVKTDVGVFMYAVKYGFVDPAELA